MSDRIELSKLVMTTKDGVAIDLTITEAKDLYEQLRQLFERKTVFLPGTPIVVERRHWPYWEPYGPTWTSGSQGAGKVTCRASSGLSVSYCGTEA